MSNVTANDTPAGKGRKVVLQLLLGMLSGAAGMMASLWLLERGDLSVKPVQAFAIGTALVFGLMALFVALGTLAPAIGARTLNVEDSDELAEQRSNLLVGSISSLLVAAFLAVLALTRRAEAPGLLEPRQAMLVALLTGASLLVWTFVHRNMSDEMMRAAAKDAGALTTNLLFVVFGTWAAAAHLGYARMFEPLLFASGFFALYLLAVFVAIGKRGLLKPR